MTLLMIEIIVLANYLHSNTMTYFSHRLNRIVVKLSTN